MMEPPPSPPSRPPHTPEAIHKYHADAPAPPSAAASAAIDHGSSRPRRRAFLFSRTCSLARSRENTSVGLIDKINGGEEKNTITEEETLEKLLKRRRIPHAPAAGSCARTCAPGTLPNTPPPPPVLAGFLLSFTQNI